MIGKKRILQSIIFTVFIIVAIIGIYGYKHHKERLMKQEEPVNENKAVSMISWYFELMNQDVFYQISEPLKELGVTRLYQMIPMECLSEPELSVMVQNLSDTGVETVLLTGDKNWVTDGLAEYCQIIDELDAYNASVSETLKIKAVALDVKVHTLEEWQENPKVLFGKYVDLMKQAKDYANAKGLQVIQIIPAYYDEIDQELFTWFLRNCCDELSIMNYNRENAFSAISTEVELCEQYDIPVETIFETMPVNDEHGVTEQITYYYDGVDVLKEDVIRMKEEYGPALGVAFHHYSILYKMCTGKYLAEIYPYGSGENQPLTENGQPLNPGKLLLAGGDGSLIMAGPYWPSGIKGKGEYCWLAAGVRENVEYTIRQYDLFHNVEGKEKITFRTQEDDIRLRIDYIRE